MSLRLRLVLAFGYVLLFAIIALEVPLDAELSRRSTARSRPRRAPAQAVAAARRGRLTDPTELAPSSREAASARRPGHRRRRRGRVLADSAAAARPRRALRQPPEIASALRGDLAGHAPQRLPQRGHALHGRADRRRRRRRRSARDPERQGVNDEDRRDVLALLPSAPPCSRSGSASRGDRRLAVAPAARHRARRPTQSPPATSPRAPTPAGSAEQVEVAGRLQRHDRPARALARRPARVRRQRLAPAAHPAHRAAPAPGGGEHASRGGGLERDLVAGEHETERLGKLVPTCCAWPRTASPPTAATSSRSPPCRARRRRWRGQAELDGHAIELAGTVEATYRLGRRPRHDARQPHRERLELRGPPTRRSGSSGARTPGGAFVAVLDRGDGIDPEEAERIFDRFYRGSASRGGTVAGPGWGLAIVDALARRWGARHAHPPRRRHPGRAALPRSGAPRPRRRATPRPRRR